MTRPKGKTITKMYAKFRPNGTVLAGNPIHRQYDNTEMYDRRAWNNSSGLA